MPVAKPQHINNKLWSTKHDPDRPSITSASATDNPKHPNFVANGISLLNINTEISLKKHEYLTFLT